MIPPSETTQPPYKLQMWPTHLLVIAAVGVAALTSAYPSATRQYTWPWAPLLAMAWLTPLAAIIGRLSFREQWTRPNSLLSAGLVLLSGVTVLSAALSPFVEHSLLRIWPTLSGVALFFWLYDWLGESAGHTQVRSQFLATNLSRFGALLAVLSALGWIWNNPTFSWSTRNDFPFGHSIYTAGAMLLVLPWLLYATVNAKGIPRAGWLVVSALGFIALFTTSSRGGVIAAGVVCVPAVVFVIFRATWSRQLKTGVIAAATFILVFAVWTNPRMRELTLGQGWSAASQESNVQRNAMLEAGAKLGATRPLLGWGPGTVPLTYPQIRHRLNGGVDSVLQLHNTPAQLWATLGSGGIIALVILLAAVARRLWQIARSSSLAPITLTATASLLGYGLFTLTDHQLDVPAMNALLVLNLALIFADEKTTQATAVSRATKWGFSLAAGIILLGPLFLTGRDLLARFAYDQSLILFEDERPVEALEYLETAAQRAPYDPYYRHQLAGRLLEQRTHAKDNAELAKLTAAATAQLEQSLRAGCLQEYAHFNLGWLALESTEPARAIPHFLATVQEAPHRGGAYFGLGVALRASGNEAAAIRAFALEWIADPVAFTAPFWESPNIAPLRPKISLEADTIIAELAATYPPAQYVRELWQWWEHGTTPPAKGFNPETNAFTQTLTALALHQPIPANAEPHRWAALLRAWRALPSENAFATLIKNDPSFAAALARRTVRHAPPNWHGFLTAGLENEPHLLVNTKFSRTGYGVLALHPDGPVLSNLYVQQQNRLVATFTAGLFPVKGWLPAKELLTRLPVLPRTP